MFSGNAAGKLAGAPDRFVASGSPTEPLCPLCGHAAGRICYHYADYQIVSCERCTLWRACPRLSPAALERYYEQEYYSEQLALAGRYEQWQAANREVWRRSAEIVCEAAQRELDLRSQDIHLLDVGCGQGFFLQECARLGLRVRGIEPSAHAARYGRESLGLDIRAGTCESLDAGERYQVVTLWEVLEHVPDPLEALLRLREHLEYGGMVWISVPNIHALQRMLEGQQYFNLRNKSHLTHFDRHTLRQILEKAGYGDIRRIVHFGGGGRHGLGAVAQYAARALCLGTDLRIAARKL